MTPELTKQWLNKVEWDLDCGISQWAKSHWEDIAPQVPGVDLEDFIDALSEAYSEEARREYGVPPPGWNPEVERKANSKDPSERYEAYLQLKEPWRFV